MIPALKVDLSAYLKDGNYVSYEEAFKKAMTRLSKTFMMEKFFNSDPVAVKSRKKL